jgi:subtilase family serine protease
VAYAAGDGPVDVGLGDMDGDGVLDAVVLDYDGRSVSVLKGKGNGTFGGAVVYGGLGNEPYHLALGDWSGDGRPDVAVAVYSGNELALYKNDGSGVLGGVLTYKASYNPIGVVSGDVNGDGLADVVTCNHTSSSGRYVTVWLGGVERRLVEDPPGMLWTGVGRGNLQNREDYDYWSFSGKAGDILSVAVEVPGSPGASQLFYDILRPDGTRLTYFYGNSYNGWGQSSPVSLPMDGTYSVAVSYNHDYWGEYRLRVTLARGGVQMESEDNNAISQADAPVLELAGGKQAGRVHGYIGVGDPNGDYYLLGNQTVGTRIALALTRPASSSLSWTLAIFLADGTKVAEEVGSPASLTHDVAVNGTYYARVLATANAGLLAQYVLGIELEDSVAPTIVSCSLPGEGTTGSGVVDRFTVRFSEDMLAGTVNEAANYELRSAGLDGVFDNEDDALYAVTTSPAYASGLSASYSVTDGPLQAGAYRFRIQVDVQDRNGNGLAAAYTRSFVIQPPPGFVIEGRNNGSAATATSLSQNADGAFDGSFVGTAAFGVGSNPYGIAAGDLDADGNQDLVLANWGSNNASVLLGNGDGTFRGAVNYGAGNNPVALALGYLNDDDYLDLAVANYSGGSVTVRLGVGDGTFGDAAVLSVGSKPNGIIVADFNGDGHADLATANRGSGNVTVFCGNGDGTFAIPMAYRSGDGAARLAAGRFDANDSLDLAVVNLNENTVSVLLGDGLGAFAAPAKYPTPNGPYAVAVGDFDGDGHLDLAVANHSGSTVSLLKGAGDGTFGPRVDYASGGSNPYHVVAADLNADGLPDLLASNYGNSQLGVIFNKGDGTFGAPVSYPAGGNAISSVAGDWNNDGRMDIATANFGNNTVSVFLGNDTEWLAFDPVGHGVRVAAGQGNLSNTGDYDYWSFSAKAGERLVVGVEVPGRPNASQLYYLIEAIDGQDLQGFYPDYRGWGQSGMITIPRDGTYLVRVSYNHDYQGEYQIRVVLTPPEVAQEDEENGSVGSASALALTGGGGTRSGAAVGYIRTAGDLDYFDLGTLESGQTVFLNARLFAGSTLAPVVSLHDAANGYVVEAPGGRPFDSVAEVRINTTGRYYAVVRGGANQGGLLQWYVLETQVMPTGSVAFPNLQVTSLLPPSGSGLESGDPVAVSFTVKNVGGLGTVGATWTDRLVISPDAVYGDLNDIELAVFPHSGALESLDEYTVSQTVSLPEGIEGEFYTIVMTDAGNAIAEFILEADNVTVSDTTFAVTRAAYSDLRVENLSAGLAGGSIEVEWTTANRGDGAARGGVVESVLLRNVVTGVVEYRTELAIAGDLGPGETAARSATLPLPAAGGYEVRVVTDSDDALFEFDAFSHASAEGNNQAAVPLDVVVDLVVVSLRVEPAGALFSGQNVTIAWQDSNLGNRPTSGSWRDRIVVRNTTSGQTLHDGTIQHNAQADGDLGPGASFARSYAFQLPHLQPGVGNIEFKVTCDEANQIAEFNPQATAEANNASAVTRASTLAPYPDLAVTAIVTPERADADQPFEVTYTVVNQGDAATSSAWSDHLYWSTRVDGTDLHYLTAVPQTSALAANGGSIEQTVEVSLPAGPSGSRYILVRTDALNQVGEKSEDLNDRYSDVIDLDVPNLTVTVTGLPAAGEGGQDVEVEWTVRNEGDGDTFAASWRDRLWLGTAPDGSGALDVLRDVEHTDTLEAGASVVRTATVTLPAGLPGNRYLVVRTDVGGAIGESDETDNTAVSDTPLDLRAPDLEVISAAAPATAQFGQVIPLMFRLRNAGNGSANGAWHDAIYFSRDGVPAGANNVLLAARPSGDASPLGPGASTANLTVNVTLPATGFADGTHYLLVRTDGYGVVTESNENNNWSAPVPITLTAQARPNLVVEDIAVPATAAPGEAFTVTWKTRNAGAADLTGSWSETVALSTDNLIGNDQTFATVDFLGTLAMGAVVERSAQVTIPLDGPAGLLYAVVTTDRGGNVIESNEADNTALGMTPVNVPLRLRLTASSARVPESANTLGFTVSRNGSRDAALTVNLSSSDTTELTVPPTVEIASGQAAAYFNGTPQKDGVADGDQLVALNAKASGFADAAATVTVTDVNQPVLTLILPATLGEGQTANATVKRDAALPTPLMVTIGSSSPSQLTAPASVTIPADEDQATFRIAAVEDTQIESDTGYELTVSAVGAVGDTKSVKVIDNDLPAVSLTFAQSEISEGAGANATMGTLSRSPVSDRALNIALQNSDATEVLVPGTLTIPANADSISFPVAAVDDDVVDGPQTVTIQPVILLRGAPFANGTAAHLTVTDNDGPTLTVAIAPDVVAEGLAEAAMGVVSRNTPPTEALDVTLSVDVPGEIAVPATVTIPKGEVEVGFAIESLDDGITDGNKAVKLTAAAADFTSGADTIVVTDTDLPDLAVEFIHVPGTGGSEQIVQATYRVRNQGTTDTGAGRSFVQRLFLSSDPLVGSDKFLGQYVFPNNVPPGQFFEVVQSFYLPRDTGQYWLIAVTDADNQVGELLEDNNTAISVPIVVNPTYRATVVVDLPVDPSQGKKIALAGTEVPLRGQALHRETGQPVPFARVNIHIGVQGTLRVFSAMCNNLGQYSISFKPFPTEAGVYEVGAEHPGMATAEPQDGFTLLGMKAEPSPATIQVVEGASATQTIQIANLGDVPLNGLIVTASSNLPNVPNANVTADLDDASTLPALGSRTLTLTVRANDASYISGTVLLQVSTVEGATLTIPVSVQVVDLKPRLVATPGSLVAAMKPGVQTTIELQLRNDGGEATGPLDVQLPPLPWLSATATRLDSLAPGEATSLMIVLKPTVDDGLTPGAPYRGAIGVGNTQYGMSVPFEFRYVTDGKGDLWVVVEDEYTYYAEGSPRVAGATVSVRDAYTGQEVVAGLTDAGGVAQFTEVLEGYYEVHVTADKHSTYSQVHFIEPAKVNSVVAFLYRQTVEYNWTVVPTAIEDRTKITIETTFETFVPVPVITIDPPFIDMSEHTLPTQQILLTIRNSGLVAAQGAKLRFSEHPWYKITPLVEDVGLVPALGEVKVPVTIENHEPGPGRAAGLADNRRARAELASVPCTITAGLDWFLICGPDRKWHRVLLPVVNVHGDCSSGGAGWWSGWGWGGYTGGGGPVSGGGTAGPGSYYSGPVSFSPPVNCDPCDPEVFESEEILTVDISSFFEPIGVAIEAYITAQTGGLVQPEVDIEASGGARTCCLDDGSVGIEVYGGAGASLEVSVGPGISKDASATISMGDSVEASISGEFKIGLQATGSISLSGEVSSGCNFSGLEVTASGEVALRFFGGVMGEATATYTAGPLEGEAEVAAINGSINGGAHISFEYKDGAMTTEACFEGIYYSAYVKLAGTTYSLFKDAEGKPIEKVYLLPSTCGPDPAGLMNALRTEVIPGVEDAVRAAIARQLGPEAAKQLHAKSGGAPIKFSGRSRATLKSASAIVSGSPGKRGGAQLMDGEGVCAKVKLRLEQEAVLTRNAFNATLEIVNGDTIPLEALEVAVNITDEYYKDMGDVFAIRLPTTPVDGTGEAAARSTWSASWILIPTREAAPESPKLYLVGGTLKYVQGGRQIIVPLQPVPITVYPDPLLYIKYFHQRDVFSDDPFTPQIEPSIPYSLAVLAENRGKGVAKNLRITSAQPQIIENEKGLLIDFEIIASQVEEENLTPSLTVSLGNIEPGATKIGRWLLRSTLQGLFIDYRVTFEHLDAIAGKKTALIDDVSIHEMIHMVAAPAPFADGRPDFLVNDLPDPPMDYPDRVYLSDGRTNEVAVVTAGVADGPPSASDTTVQLTASLPPGFVYLRVPEPSGGQMKLHGVRQGNRDILMDVHGVTGVANAWVTDRTFVGQGKKPVRENILHLFDYNANAVAGPVTYTLIYEELPPLDISAPISAVKPLPARSALSFAVTWAGQDADGSAVAAYDIYVSDNGGPFALWLTNTRFTGGQYTGQMGHTYAFYSRAKDAAGNLEPAPVSPDAITLVAFETTAPHVSEIADQVMVEDTVAHAVPFAVGDPDTPLDALRINVQSSNLTLLPLSGLAVSGSGADRVLAITPEPGRSGEAQVTLTVSDGSSSASRTFLARVIAVNDAPVAGNDLVTRPLDRGVKVAVSELLANDADPEFDPLTLTGVSAVSRNGANIRLVGGWVFYEPTDSSGNEPDEFTYVVSDGKGGLGEGRVFVQVVSDGPIAAELKLSANPDGTVVLEFVGIPGRWYAIERASSLANPVWEVVDTVQADSIGLIRYTDASPPAGTAFYRAADLSAH